VTVIGIDDTDSRKRGMCTTYVAARVVDGVRDAGGTVSRTLLVRLNPAVEHKTRGNAALAVHCDLPADDALAIADDELDRAETDDPRTNPGAVVSPARPEAVPTAVADLSRRAVREYVTLAETRETVESAGLRTAERKTGRGLVGATAAVGAFRAFDEWTYECITYRDPKRWGTEREVETASVFAAADEAYPDVWDTVDHGEGVAVCVPRTPCPILHGIRGEDAAAVEAVAKRIDGEPVAFRHTFRTNQGTDAHIRDDPDGLRDGRSYRVTGTVHDAPETAEGGHVFATLRTDGERLRCAAFEPTKRFRDRVRSLRAGDRVTVCGEVSDGTLKLEKFAVRSLVTTERVNPTCPECGRSMASAGANAGYRCRDCGTSADEKPTRELEREIEEGWYEVPPVARRHIAKPLVRGGFDAPTHPER
jgi:tRNA(Ile2)-agmatinylcytidine synthase